MPESSSEASTFTLTQMTFFGRQAVKVLGISLVVLIVGRMAFSAFIAYWKATHPPPPPPPTVGFGILPTIEFPSQDQELIPKSFVLETANGSTPDFGDRAKVFLIIKSSPSLLADQTAKKIAASLGYVFEPEKLNSTTYRWTLSQPLLSNLELNILNHHFSITTDFLSKPELLVAPNLPTGFSAVSLVKNSIDSTDLLPGDIATASGEILYLKSVGGELIPAVSESDADFVQVDINRNPIDGKFRMYTPKGYTGVISAIVAGGSTKQGQVVQLNYSYNQVDYSQVHTYPIRSSQEAWQILKAGEGYIVSSEDPEKAVIRSVSMGYYDSFDEQDYLQPIYVFEGDNNFLGFVPAISPEFLQPAR